MVSLFQEFFPDGRGLYLWILPSNKALGPLSCPHPQMSPGLMVSWPVASRVAPLRLCVPTFCGLWVSS